MTPPPAAKSRVPACLLLLALPLLLLVTLVWLQNARGPFWLSVNMDPSYMYLLNSLNVANLHRPFHVDNPGTPVQVFGGATFRLLNLFSDEETLARKVLSDPEGHIRLLTNLLAALYAVSLAAAGFVAFRVSRSVAAGALVQLAPFLSLTLLYEVIGTKPEALLATISTLLLTLILLTFKYDVSRHALRYALAFGLLCGVGTATKWTFLPMLLIPFSLLPTWKWRIYFSLAAAAAFVVAVIPIIHPWQLRVASQFLFGVATRSGVYGTGRVGLPGLGQWLANLYALLRNDWLFYLIVASSVPLLTLKSLARSLGGARYRALLAVTFVQLLQLLVTAKQPYGRYMITVMSLSGLNLFLLFEVVRSRAASVRGAARGLAFAAVCLPVLCFQLALVVRLRERLTASAAEHMAVHRLVESEFKGVPVVNYFAASSQAYALKYGSEFSNNFYGRVLEEMYPGRYFYNPGARNFSNFVGRVDFGRDDTPGGWFVMHGLALNDADYWVWLDAPPLPDNVVVESIYGGLVDRPGVFDGEAVYKASFK